MHDTVKNNVANDIHGGVISWPIQHDRQNSSECVKYKTTIDTA